MPKTNLSCQEAINQQSQESLTYEYDASSDDTDLISISVMNELSRDGETWYETWYDYHQDRAESVLPPDDMGQTSQKPSMVTKSLSMLGSLSKKKYALAFGAIGTICALSVISTAVLALTQPYLTPITTTITCASAVAGITLLIAGFNKAYNDQQPKKDLEAYSMWKKRDEPLKDLKEDPNSTKGSSYTIDNHIGESFINDYSN